MLDFIKVSVKTNAATASFLRLQENKALHRGRTFKIVADREEETELSQEDQEKSDAFYNLYQNLRHRRTHELRKKQRNLLLAYGFLRGFEYSDMEEGAYTRPDFDEVEKNIFLYIDDREDPRIVKQKYEEWVQVACANIDPHEKVA